MENETHILVEQGYKAELSRVPKAISDEININLALHTPLANNSSILTDMVIYFSHCQRSDLFGAIRFTAEEFAEKMGYQRTHLQRKLTVDEKMALFNSIEPPVFEMEYGGIVHYHPIETVLEAALWKITKENYMFRRPNGESTSYKAVNIVEQFDIRYDITTKKKTKREYEVHINNKVKDYLLHNYNLIEMGDYRKLSDRPGYRYFYLRLVQMIVSVKYKMSQQTEPIFKFKVDDLAKIFDIQCKTPSNTKAKVTKILNNINSTLEATKFRYEFVKDGDRFAYTVIFTFPQETLEIFNENLKAAFTARLYKACSGLYSMEKFEHLPYSQRWGAFNDAMKDSAFEGEFLDWFFDKKDIEKKKEIYNKEFLSVFGKSPQDMGVPEGNFIF